MLAFFFRHRAGIRASVIRWCSAVSERAGGRKIPRPRCGAVANFDFFHCGSCGAPHRHHCLAALRDGNGPAHRTASNTVKEPINVQTLFDAALRQQLQGPPCAGAAQCALSCDRDRHPARREPHAGIPRQESERTGAAAGSRGRTLPRGVQCHPLVCRRRHLAGAGNRIERAEALQWMFFEQHALEPNIGAAYFWLSLVKGGRTCRPMRWKTGWSAAMPRCR